MLFFWTLGQIREMVQSIHSSWTSNFPSLGAFTALKTKASIQLEETTWGKWAMNALQPTQLSRVQQANGSGLGVINFENRKVF